MAMRVVTLKKLGEYIENKLGSKQVMIKTDSYIRYIDSTSNSVSCEIPNAQVNNLHDENPFLRYRDQIKGVLEVNGTVVDDVSIRPYTYLLD